jgi:hypothetical protein
MAVLGSFLADFHLEGDLRAISKNHFGGFLHFAAFQMLAGVQFKVRMGKPSTEGLKCVFPMNRFL